MAPYRMVNVKYTGRGRPREALISVDMAKAIRREGSEEVDWSKTLQGYLERDYKRMQPVLDSYEFGQDYDEIVRITHGGNRIESIRSRR